MEKDSSRPGSTLNTIKQTNVRVKSESGAGMRGWEVGLGLRVGLQAEEQTQGICRASAAGTWSQSNLKQLLLGQCMRED